MEMVTSGERGGGGSSFFQFMASLNLEKCHFRNARDNCGKLMEGGSREVLGVTCAKRGKKSQEQLKTLLGVSWVIPGK